MENAIHTTANVDVQKASVAKTVSNPVSTLTTPTAAYTYDGGAVCGSLADGDQRYPRKEGETCGCTDGWGGINCNGERPELHSGESMVNDTLLVCQNDNACSGFPLRGDWNALDDEPAQNMTCYKGGLTVNSNYQMCDVTSTHPNTSCVPCLRSNKLR